MTQDRSKPRVTRSPFGVLPRKRILVRESGIQVVDHSQMQELIQHLNVLRSEMLELETSGLAGCAEVHPEHTASAKNLMHYLALRRHDIRHLQSQLAALGLSSLGRTESHVMTALHSVANLLGRLTGSDEAFAQPSNGFPGLGDGALLLKRNTEALLGAAPAGRNVRIMVTMPPEAATDYELVRDLLSHGMDCMRINCAHDGPQAWSAMIANLRRAEKETDKHCKIAMDLAGPKLRTGPMQPGPAALKYRPKRDALGRVLSPARIWLTPSSVPEIPPEPADAVLPMPRAWLARLKRKDCIRFTDARGASRTMTVSGVVGQSRWAEAVRTAYIVPGLVFEVRGARQNGTSRAAWRGKVEGFPPMEQTLLVQCDQVSVVMLREVLDVRDGMRRGSREVGCKQDVAETHCGSGGSAFHGLYPPLGHHHRAARRKL
jgi:pyruvate kinase